jgi:hypothetical protein
MMAKEPVDRYQTAADVVQALLPFTEHPPMAATSSVENSDTVASTHETVVAVQPNPNQHKRLVLGLWLGIILLIVVIAAMLLR